MYVLYDVQVYVNCQPITYLEYVIKIPYKFIWEIAGHSAYIAFIRAQDTIFIKIFSNNTCDTMHTYYLQWY